MTNLSKSVIVTTTTAPNSSIRALIDDENGGGSYDFGYNNNCVYNDICGYYCNNNVVYIRHITPALSTPPTASTIINLDKNAPVKLLRDVSHKVREEKMIENEAGSQGKEEYLYDCLQNN
ncbi:1404_t:CDS:2 [Entrophospora sp. SA101]|nr:1403_t:CDS:2 [Entrophospora sp. SA101]CAJ0873511.1 1404_t:CDS:2 [Entrophospora sp. SA101]